MSEVEQRAQVGERIYNTGGHSHSFPPKSVVKNKEMLGFKKKQA